MFSPISEAFSSPSPPSVTLHLEDIASSECPTFLPSNQPDHVKAQLEHLSMQAVNLIANKQFSSPLLRCFSPNLKSVYEGVTINTGRDAIFDQIVRVSEQYPDWRTEAVDALAEG